MSPLRTVIASALVACVVVLAASAWLDRASPVSITIEPMESGPIRVSVAGAVATPGVVTVAAGARLEDVATAAGGFTDDADFSGLNLAGRIGDGEHIVVPRIASTDDGAVAPTAEAAVPSGPLDLNTASVTQLEELPGIGEVLAGRIVTYREAHGAFASVDDLGEVDGISQGLLETLRPLITVSHGG